MWDEAISRARYLDSLPDSFPKGAFHGLPISVKEHPGMNGKTNHACFVKRIGDKSDANPINEIP